MSNSKTRFNRNNLGGNAATTVDGKPGKNRVGNVAITVPMRFCRLATLMATGEDFLLRQIPAEIPDKIVYHRRQMKH